MKMIAITSNWNLSLIKFIWESKHVFVGKLTKAHFLKHFFTSTRSQFSINMKCPIHATAFDPEFDRLRSIKGISEQKPLEFSWQGSNIPWIITQVEKRRRFQKIPPSFAAMGNCSDLLLLLLKHEPDIYSRDMYGRSTLHWAAKYGSLAAVKVLIDQGANINALDFKNTTNCHA